MKCDNRIRIIVGHYGSGKTEFAINYVMKLSNVVDNVVIIDLDIVNVYFRSREKVKLLKENSIKVISSSLGHNSILDVPALSASISAPLQNNNCNVVIDVGGDAIGANVLARFKGTIERDQYDMFYVLNAYRKQTQNVEDTVEDIKAIESASGLNITGIISNTHLLGKTFIEDIIKGYELAKDISQNLNIPIKYVSYLANMEDKLPKELKNKAFSLELYMREEWM